MLTRTRAPVAALVLLGAVVGAWRGGFTDLAVYRFAGRAVLDGNAIYGVRDPVEGLPFTYPPFGAMLMTPLALVPLRLVSALWTAASVAAMAGSVLLVRRSLGRPSSGWLLALVVAGSLALEPVWQNASFGQVNAILVLALLADLLRPERRWSGVLVGIAAAVKLTPLVFVVLLVLVGRRTSAVRALAVFLVTVALGFAVTPAASTTYWSTRLWRAQRIGPPELAHNQSVFGALTRIGGGSPPVALWLLLAVPLALAVLVVAAAWWRRGERALGTCLAAVAMLFASPVSWSHHWVWAVPVALVLWEHARWAAAAWTAVFVLRPMLWLPWGQGREYEWSAIEQVPGNAYLLAGLAFVGWATVRLRRGVRPATPPVRHGASRPS